MRPRDPSSDSGDPIADRAADWVIRLERGLSPAEQDRFSEWLAADPRNSAAFAEQRWSWEELDRLTGLQATVSAVPDPRLLSDRPARARKLSRIAAWSLAAGVSVLVAVLTGQHFAPQPALARSDLLRLCEQQTLSDGSTVDLARGAVISVHFDGPTRRVRLDRGEAFFSVAKDPARPFIVEAAGVAVRAVGTAFNVSLGQSAVSVLVTEGKVRVAATPADTVEAAPMVAAGQNAVVSLVSRESLFEIASVTPAQIEEHLAWKPRILDFDEAPLGEIADEFNRRNPVKLTIPEPGLRTRRLSATIRSDNVEGFVKLLESDFGIRAEWPSATFIVLRTAN